MSFRMVLSLVTIVLLVAVVYFARHEIIDAWHLLGTVNLWVLALMIPLQVFSYYATGSMIFSYLRQKGNLKKTTHWQMTRMALELNFVNHVLPSGGAAGFSYLSWVLTDHGVRPGRATMAQIVRFVLTFIAFVVMLLISVLVVAIDAGISRLVLLVSLSMVAGAIGGSALLIYIIGSERRLKKFAAWLTLTTNGVVRKVTGGKKRIVLYQPKIEQFFEELHQDYLELRREKKILLRPFIWATLANAADVALLFVAFAALGIVVSPAMLLIAFGVASIVSAFSITPGGAGVYEALMITFLASAGVKPDVAIAGTLLARTILMVGTIAFGYVFYQLTLLKNGKPTTQR
jgi:putative heme transporter